MSLRINLNADLGEGFGPWRMGDDAAMLDLVNTASIACGFHAGDPLVMTRTIREALARGVSIGAHPGFPDLQGFGRRPMTMSEAEVEAMVAYQIGALSGIAATRGGQVSHVKPHGALSNMAAVDAALAGAVARAVKGVDPGLILLAPAGSELAKAGQDAGLPTAEEMFADRAYDDRGNLVSRKEPNAMIHDPGVAAENVLRMIREKVVVSVSGKRISCGAVSVCVHGDDPAAVSFTRQLRTALLAAGITTAPLPELIQGETWPIGTKT